MVLIYKHIVVLSAQSFVEIGSSIQETIFEGLFIIYGHGRHLGHVT